MNAHAANYDHLVIDAPPQVSGIARSIILAADSTPNTLGATVTSGPLGTGTEPGPTDLDREGQFTLVSVTQRHEPGHPDGSLTRNI